MLGLVTLPSNFTALVAGNAGIIFTDLAPVATLIIGVLLGLFIISWIINTLRGGRNNYEEMNDWETKHHGHTIDEHDDNL